VRRASRCSRGHRSAPLALAACAQRLVHGPQVLDRRSDVTGPDVLAALDRIGRFACGAGAGEELVVLTAYRVGELALLEYLLDEVARGRQCADGILLEQLVELAPARLPLV
jgi:hypothetical protein